MKQAKNTGALIVSLLLAVVLLGITATGALTIGVQTFKAVKDGGEMKDPVIEGDSWPEDEPLMPETAYEGDVYAESVTLKSESNDGGEVWAVVTGTLSNGNMWQYYTKNYIPTELEPFQQIARYEDLFIFNDYGTVVALDALTGDEVWCNPDFGGQSIASFVDEDGTMYLCGYYGPDLCIIDINGNTLDYIQVFDYNYCWPYSVTKDSTNGLVTIKFEQGPSGDEGAIAYNLNNQSYYAFEGELTLASEMQPWQRSFLEAKASNTIQEKYNRFGLVHIDDDGIPEMIVRGSDDRAVLWYDAAADEVKMVSFTGDGIIGYFPGTGLFSYVTSEYTAEESSTTTEFYRLSGGVVEELDTLWYRSYKDTNDDYQYEYKYNGASVDSNEYFDKQSVLEAISDGVESMTANVTNADDVDSYILSWYDPSDDESIWKELFNEEIEYRTEYDGFYLEDLNGDSVPELFMYDRASYGDFGYIMVCDVQTHQVSMTYTSADHVGRKPGTNLVFDSSIYSSFVSDYLYEVQDYRIAKIEDGFRMVYSETDMDCYLDDEQVSMEEYVAAFSALMGENEYLIDSCVSYDDIVKQLQ